MDEFQAYLDLYAPERQVLRAALDGKIVPSSHYESYFNAPFPTLRTGLNGLSIIGQPLPRPAAATMNTTGYVAPPPAWLQAALNALVAVAPAGTPGAGLTPLVVDGVAGPATLAATKALSTSVGGGAWASPYLVNVGGVRTVAMKRDLLIWLIDKHLVEVAGPTRSSGASSDSGADTSTADPSAPLPSSSGVGGFLLVAAAIAAGLYFAR